MDSRNGEKQSPRASGILAHPTSLPGPHGIGDLGGDAYRFVDYLASAKQRIWQILPLGRPGLGYSPYAALSAFAGNPLLVSLERLADQGLLSGADLAGAPPFREDFVDYAAVETYKLPRLWRAYERFVAAAPPRLRAEFAAFQERQRSWLADFALYVALKDAHGGAAWNTWEPELAKRRPEALAEARERLAWSVGAAEFQQFQFFRQWGELKTYANERGIRIMGDIPIFIAYDSADVWANQELFHLDDEGRPTVVAGVPPDIFSATGQRWGNPLYRWDKLRETGYAWWIERLGQTLELVDLMRVDHFRGFEAYWEVPASAPTAESGRWVKGPGAELFVAATQRLGPLPIIVEDLGLITDEVIALREELGYPGMKVLQFAFGDDARNPYLPHNYTRDFLVYTGTHDNDTTRGWFAKLPARHRENVLRYLGTDGHDVTWDLIRLAMMSVAEKAVFPLQDVLDLGSEARMNYPGRPDGNWRWRVRAEQLRPDVAARLADLTVCYGRDRSRVSLADARAV